MSKKLIALLFLLLAQISPISQEAGYLLEGYILNTSNEPMQGAHVYLQETEEQTLTSAEGKFQFSGLESGVYRLHVSYVGYQCIHPYRLEIVDDNITVSVIMEAVGQALDEVVVEADFKNAGRKTAQTVVTASERFIRENRGSSLMTSLEKLPGIQAMSIGQGLSKPMIRGLSFNRVAVSENNIKMEGQQWGADHGLEIDQFGVEQIEIIKGPSSLRFGSDAAGWCGSNQTACAGGSGSIGSRSRIYCPFG